MDFGAISAALAAAGSATSILNDATNLATRLRESLKPDQTNPEIQAQLLQLYGQLLDALRDMSCTENRLQEINRQLRQHDEFEKEAGRYVLEVTEAGARIYQLRRDDDRGEPPHAICPNCRHERIIAILQPYGKNLKCVRCGTAYGNKLSDNQPSRKRGHWMAY